MKKFSLLLIISLLLIGCGSLQPAQSAISTVSAISTAVSTALPEILEPDKVPHFDHIVLILLENRDYKDVIGSKLMPNLNELAHKNVLLSNYYAVGHPSLPNYIALVSGSTANIKSDCKDCFVNEPNLADLLEASGRTWKTYQEDMPSPCFVGDAKPYYQKHNPFIYFDSIRLNPERCNRSVVPLTELDSDLASNQLPSFALIIPNNCNSGHSCKQITADSWLQGMVSGLQSSPALGEKSLIIITFDEGGENSNSSCCGLGSKGGGKVAAILISPQAKPGFVDATAYSHYSILKTILMAWKLPELGFTEPESTQPIISPWLPGVSSPASGAASLP